MATSQQRLFHIDENTCIIISSGSSVFIKKEIISPENWIYYYFYFFFNLNLEILAKLFNLSQVKEKDKIADSFDLFCVSVIWSCVIWPIYGLKNRLLHSKTSKVSYVVIFITS